LQFSTTRRTVRVKTVPAGYAAPIAAARDAMKKGRQATAPDPHNATSCQVTGSRTELLRIL
jgi:hypothetical protein